MWRFNFKINFALVDFTHEDEKHQGLEKPPPPTSCLTAEGLGTLSNDTEADYRMGSALYDLCLKDWLLVFTADRSHHVVLALHHAVGGQHGSLHGGALEHPFDLAANAADPEGLAPLRRAPAGGGGRPGLAKCY